MSVAAVLDRHAGATQAFMVVGPLILGFPAITGLFNPIWGSLLILPLSLVLAATDYPPSNAESALILASILLWPLLLLGLMTWSSGWLIRLDSPWREPAMLAWLASVLFLVPVDWADAIL